MSYRLWKMDNKEENDMKRRSFIQTILGITGAATVPAGAAATAPPARRILLQECELAGFQYYEGEHLFPRLREGDELVLRREPQNPYDNRAVEVRWNGSMLGHIPRVANTAVSQMIDRGEKLQARISGIRDTLNPWNRIRIEIYLTT